MNSPGPMSQTNGLLALGAGFRVPNVHAVAVATASPFGVSLKQLSRVPQSLRMRMISASLSTIAAAGKGRESSRRRPPEGS